MNGADYGVNSFMLFSYLLPRITDDSVADFLNNNVLPHMENKFPKITCNGVRNLKLIMEDKVNEWNSGISTEAQEKNGGGDKNMFIKLIESLVIWEKTDTADDKEEDDKEEDDKEKDNKEEDDKKEDNKEDTPKPKQETFDIKRILKESFSNFSETLIYTKTGEDGKIGKKILKTLNNEVVNVLDLNKRRKEWGNRVGTKIGNVGTQIGNFFGPKKTDDNKNDNNENKDDNKNQKGGTPPVNTNTVPNKIDTATATTTTNGMTNNMNIATAKDMGMTNNMNTATAKDMGMGMDMSAFTSGNPADAFSDLAASKEEMKALAELAEKFMTNIIHHFVPDENKMYGIFSEKILGIIQESTSSVIAEAKSPEVADGKSEAKPLEDEGAANKSEVNPSKDAVVEGGGGDNDDKPIDSGDIVLEVDTTDTKTEEAGDTAVAADTKNDGDDEGIEHKADAGEENPAIIKQNVEDFFTSIMDFLIKNKSELHIMILEILSEKISSIYNSIDENGNINGKEDAENKDSYMKFKKHVQYALQKNCNDKP
jgi:hypothetical protein